MQGRRNIAGDDSRRPMSQHEPPRSIYNRKAPAKFTCRAYQPRLLIARWPYQTREAITTAAGESRRPTGRSSRRRARRPIRPVSGCVRPPPADTRQVDAIHGPPSIAFDSLGAATEATTGADPLPSPGDRVRRLSVARARPADAIGGNGSLWIMAADGESRPTVKPLTGTIRTPSTQIAPSVGLFHVETCNMSPVIVNTPRLCHVTPWSVEAARGRLFVHLRCRDPFNALYTSNGALRVRAPRLPGHVHFVLPRLAREPPRHHARRVPACRVAHQRIAKKALVDGVPAGRADHEPG